MCQSRFLLCMQAAVVVLVCVNGSQTATAQRRGEENRGEWLLRTYQVDDLVLDVRDHPYSDVLKRNVPSTGGFGGGGGGFFSVPDESNAGTDRLGATGRPSGRFKFAQYGAGFGGGGGGFGGGGFGGGGQPAPTVVQVEPRRTSTSNISMDDLVRVITSSIAADSWADHGGEAQIEQLGTSLVVWQTAQAHQQIQFLLRDLRAGAGERATITIDARWLLLDSDDLDRLWERAENGRRQVDRDVLDEFTRRPGSIRGITNCFSGQLVYVVSGTRRSFVQSYIPVVGSVDPVDRGVQFLVQNQNRDRIIQLAADENVLRGGNGSRVGYQPIVNAENFGALLEIRPTLIRGEDTAVVDLKSTITVPAEPVRDHTAVRGEVPLVPAVDRIAIETQELASSFRMPLGKPVLVGGLTYVPVAKGVDDTGHRIIENQPAGEASEKLQLYFVVELTSSAK